MKRIVVYVCTVAVISVALPVFAVAQADWKKDCQFNGKNCPNAADSLPERIARLKTEIAKGEKVYAPEELLLLERKLKENVQTMRTLNKPGK